MANDFDARALFEAMDAQRTARGLSWPQVARELWEQSSALNQRRQDHPISPSTLTGLEKRGDCTCQHALFVLRWLGRSPESFVRGYPAGREIAPLPRVGDDRRLRWSLSAVYESLNDARLARSLTWRELARELRCSESQLTGIRTARYAIGMTLMMRIVLWLERPAAAFVYAAEW